MVVPALISNQNKRKIRKEEEEDEEVIPAAISHQNKRKQRKEEEDEEGEVPVAISFRKICKEEENDNDFEEEENTIVKKSEKEESNIASNNFERERNEKEECVIADNNFEKEESEEEDSEEDKIMKNHITDIGKSLHILLINIHKIPILPPTNHLHMSPEDYRKIVTNLIQEDKNEYFTSSEIFTSVKNQKSQGSSLNFILNDNNQIIQKIDDEYKDPNVACTVISKVIVDIYKETLENHVLTEQIRRKQFRDILSINENYEKLQIYCMRSKERKKGVTAKSQAIQWIVKSSKPAKDKPPMITAPTVSKLIKGAVRIKRLLGLSNNNYNILDTFPDLKVEFFTTTSMSVVNYERWLKLVETDNIISFEEGKILYEEHKTSSKTRRLEQLKK